MRQVKFRFWDPFNRAMQYSGDSIADFFMIYEAAVKGGNGPKLMQFTGLYDRDGKEIYEGDLLMTRDWTDGRKWIHGVVKFIDGAFTCEHGGGLMTRYSVHLTAEDTEVIGNIHEGEEEVSDG